MSALVLQSCTHGMNDSISNEVSLEPVSTQADLAAEIDASIESMANLGSDKKQKLIQIRTTTRDRLEALQTDSLRTRSLIVKEVMSDEYNLRRVERLKNRLKKIETEKLKVIFGSIDDANKTLGRQSERESRKRVFEDLIGSGPRGLGPHIE